jgi:hypothetical protein
MRRNGSYILLLVAVLFAAFTAACSSGASDGSSAPSDGWTSQEGIQVIFENNCATCHLDQFSTCWWVNQQASAIDQMVSGGAMPPSGLPAATKTTLVNWVQAGAKCTGTPPADAGSPPTVSFSG